MAWWLMSMPCLAKSEPCCLRITLEIEFQAHSWQRAQLLPFRCIEYVTGWHWELWAWVPQPIQFPQPPLYPHSVVNCWTQSEGLRLGSTVLISLSSLLLLQNSVLCLPHMPPFTCLCIQEISLWLNAAWGHKLGELWSKKKPVSAIGFKALCSQHQFPVHSERKLLKWN
jgi:hypothetical protein